MATRKYLGGLILSAALLLAFALPSLAKNARTVAVPHEAVLNGVTLPAGHYLVEWDTHTPAATVRFTLDKKVVLSAEGTLEDRGTKYGKSMVVYDSTPAGAMSISEIRLAGSSQALVFKQ